MRYKRNIILGLLSVVFLAMTFFLYIGGDFKLNSPDESANFFFINQFIETRELKAHMPVYQVADGNLLPRSMKLVGEYLVPGGFWGLPLLYGVIGIAVGSGMTVFLTGLFAVVACWALLYLWRLLFGGHIAFWATVLTFLNPAMIYYASRGLLPNVLFVSLGICAIAIIVYSFRASDKPDWLRVLMYTVGFICGGYALFVRPVELFWIVPVCIFLGIAYRRYLLWRVITLGGAIFAVLALIALYINRSVYSGFLNTGHQIGLSENAGFLRNILDFVFPFDVQLQAILPNFTNYYVLAMWWLSIPLAFGVVFALQRWHEFHKRAYTLAFLLVTILLVLYYGSWNFTDNITPGEYTIGTSYIRYWLPSFIMGAPFVVAIVSWAHQQLGRTRDRFIFAAMIIVAIGYANISYTFNGAEGLLAVKKNMHLYVDVHNQVADVLPENALLLTDRTDKMFFPEISVMEYGNNFGFADYVPALLAERRLFIFTRFPDETIEYMQEQYFNKNNIAWSLIASDIHGHRLFEIAYE